MWDPPSGGLSPMQLWDPPSGGLSPMRLWDPPSGGLSPMRVVGSAFRRIGSAISLRLNTVKLCVLTAFRHELVVSADFRHLRARQYDDQIGHSDGGEAMRDQDRDCLAGGAGTARGSRVSLKQRVLGFGIERCGRFVED